MKLDFIDALRKSVVGAVYSGTDVETKARKALWNAATNLSPAALVECLSTQDVQLAASIAADHHLPVSVLGPELKQPSLDCG